MDLPKMRTTKNVAFLWRFFQAFACARKTWPPKNHVHNRLFNVKCSTIPVCIFSLGGIWIKTFAATLNFNLKASNWSLWTKWLEFGKTKSMKLRENCKQKSDEKFAIDREHKQQKSHVLSGNLHVKKQHSKNVKTTRGGQLVSHQRSA